MTLIVVCGQPSSGKSTVTQQLVALCTEQGLQVSFIDEPSLGLERNSSYKDVVSEKNTRGLVRSSVERKLSKKGVLILDSLNNIKGYRYELWCIARAAGTRYCVVFVDSPTPQCAEWNATRDSPAYDVAIFDDLAGRFERPDSKNRWDHPLFEVHPARDSAEEAHAILRDVVAAVSGPATTAATMGGSRTHDLQPTIATTVTKLAGTNVLHEIDRAAQDIIDCVDAASTSAAGGAPGVVQFGDDVPALKITQSVTLAELRRLKRDFLRLATKNTFTRLQDSLAARRMFVEYLSNNLHA